MIKRHPRFPRSLSIRPNAVPQIHTSCLWLTLTGVLVLALLPLNGREAKVLSQENLTTLPPGRPTIVYVQDFKVEKESSGNDQTLGGGRARAIIAQVKSATGMQSSQVVDLMSSSLVSDLNRAGVKAVRLAAGRSLPKSGWLVRGVFTEVDEGSRVLRAEVGFGAGATDLAVLVNVADLQKGKAEPFYKLETQPKNAGRDRDEEPLCSSCEVRHVSARSAEEYPADRADYRRPNYSSCQITA
jgi:hypothetical protein